MSINYPTYALVSFVKRVGNRTIGRIEALGTYKEIKSLRVRKQTGIWAVSKLAKIGELMVDYHGNIEDAIKER